ncbi:hypothetical protein EVAR_102589_1 [Eumeta japonica]|uniref:Uncharacterized protein n=1 Tax=Eumeta variegata TaxID=151549 RepID=A0A4C1TUN3_EUMVA|nr:hypothetical protein EVAR_102589_1 [Eumeta japonica]
MVAVKEGHLNFHSLDETQERAFCGCVALVKQAHFRAATKLATAPEGGLQAHYIRGQESLPNYFDEKLDP